MYYFPTSSVSFLLPFHLSFYLSSPLSFPLISSSGCLWAPGRVCPSWACTSVSCTVRPAPSAAWQEIPTAPGTDTPAAPTCQPYGGRGDKLYLFIQTTLIRLFRISLTSWIFFPLKLRKNTWKQSSLIRFKPHLLIVWHVAHITFVLWLKFKHFFHLTSTWFLYRWTCFYDISQWWCFWWRSDLSSSATSITISHNFHSAHTKSSYVFVYCNFMSVSLQEECSSLRGGRGSTNSVCQTGRWGAKIL